MTDAANRRLAAIMMLDVVGYSQMMAEDEAGTLARLLDARRSILEPTLARFDGRIVKLMGDGVLAEFSSVTAATECAKAIQRAMAGLTGATPIRLRIGINLGEVIADGDDIYGDGDGVNVAARIEALAKPGGVTVSRSVHDQLGPKAAARFADGGSHQAGVIDPERKPGLFLEVLFPFEPGSGHAFLDQCRDRLGVIGDLVLDGIWAAKAGVGCILCKWNRAEEKAGKSEGDRTARVTFIHEKRWTNSARDNLPFT